MCSSDLPTPTPTITPTPTPTPTITPTPTPTITLTPTPIYSYNIYYDYNDGPCTIIGFSGTTDACNATNYITTFSNDSTFGVGTVLYCDNTLTQEINAVVPYNVEPGQKYYMYDGNYITFETNNHTVHSIDVCPSP